MKRRIIASALALCLLAPWVPARAADWSGTQEEALAEYERLALLDAGDAIDLFLNKLPQDQRQWIEDQLNARLEEPKGTCGKAVNWEYDGRGVLTISGTGKMASYSAEQLPPWHDVRFAIHTVVIRGVTNVGDNAFADCISLCEVNFGSVTDIGAGAFRNSGLDAVVLPTGLKSLGAEAFSGCAGLGSIAVPESVTRIENGTFRGCASLLSVSLPRSLNALGDDVFSGCAALKNLMLPQKLAEIGENLCDGCTALNNIRLPDTLEQLPAGTLRGCTALTAVNLPAGVTAIGDEAFAGCSGLTGLKLPAGLLSLGNGVFRDCTALDSVILPQDAGELGSDCFEGCVSLKTLIFSEKTQVIPSGAFRDCTGLEELTIPASVDEIGAQAFSGCDLKRLVFIGGAPSADSELLSDSHAAISYPCDADGWKEARAQWLGSLTWQPEHPTGSAVREDALPPTCTQDGYTQGTSCYACGEPLSGMEPVEAAGHRFENGICTVCGEREDAPEETEPETEPTQPETEPAQPETEPTVPTEAEEESEPTLILSKTQGAAGSRVTMELTMEANPGIVSAALTLEYDDTVMTLVRVEDAKLLPGGEFAEKTQSPYPLTWANDTLEADVTDSGLLAKLIFQLAEDAPAGEYTVKVSACCDNCDVFNAALETIRFKMEEGTVTVTGSISGDVNGDGTVDEKDRDALAQYLSGRDSGEGLDLKAADVNADGKVNNLDRAILSRHLAGWEDYQKLPYKK